MCKKNLLLALFALVAALGSNNKMWCALEKEKTYYVIARENKNSNGEKTETYRFIVISVVNFYQLPTIDDLITLSKIATMKKYNDNTYLIEDRLDDLENKEEFQNAWEKVQTSSSDEELEYKFVERIKGKKNFKDISCKMLDSSATVPKSRPDWLPEDFDHDKLDKNGFKEDDQIWVNTKDKLSNMFASVKKQPKVTEEALKKTLKEEKQEQKIIVPITTPVQTNKIIVPITTPVQTNKTIFSPIPMYIKTVLWSGLLGFIQNLWPNHQKLGYLTTGGIALGTTWYRHKAEQAKNTGIKGQIFPYVPCIAGYATGNMLSKLIWHSKKNSFNQQ